MSAAPAVALLLCGCAVGPDFHRPAAPADAGFAPKPLPTISASAAVYGGVAQHLVSGQDIPFDWWKTFQCPQLDALVAQALRANPTIESAKAALRQAHELTLAAKGDFFPTVQASFSPSRNLTALGAVSPASANGSTYYTLITGQLSVLLRARRVRRQPPRSRVRTAQAHMQRFEPEATYLTLAANVVGAAIQEARRFALKSQRPRKSLRRTESRLGIVRDKSRLGYAMGIDVAAQDAALAQVKQLLPPLKSSSSKRAI